MASAIATTIQHSAPSLTRNDAAVLQALFDAEMSVSSAPSYTENIRADPLPNISKEKYARLRTESIQVLAPLSTDSNTTTSPKTIQTALTALNDLIALNSNYAPAYLDRAQALRLLREAEEPAAETPQEQIYSISNDLTIRILSDLSKAIFLASSNSSFAITKEQRDLLSSAHTHRGYVLLKAAKSVLSSSPSPPSTTNTTTSTSPYTKMSSQDLEASANLDFQLGAKYGNNMAKQLAVGRNPYAKMCGEIVREALQKERAGEA